MVEELLNLHSNSLCGYGESGSYGLLSFCGGIPLEISPPQGILTWTTVTNRAECQGAEISQRATIKKANQEGTF